jgi:hypothetical protein
MLVGSTEDDVRIQESSLIKCSEFKIQYMISLSFPVQTVQYSTVQLSLAYIHGYQFGRDG